MNSYPVGNVIKCPFAFTTRKLTTSELQNFLVGNGLPPGIGADQTTVKFDWILNDNTPTTLTGGQITHDAAGEYHATITLTTPGTIRYRGYSLDGGSNPVASTEQGEFQATPFPT